jgi:hypothetical protein
MRERVFAHDPKVDGMCYGFWELHLNSQRIVHHAGDTFLFHSLFALLPEHRVGLFVAYNTDRGEGAPAELLTVFLDRYYPAAESPRPEPSPDLAALERFAGDYRAARISHTTYAKVAALMTAYPVRANADGTLTAGSGSQTMRYVQVEPLVFQQLDGRRRIVFGQDDLGHVTHLFFSELPAIALVRSRGVDQTRFQWALLGATAIVFASTLVLWPAFVFARRNLQTPPLRRTAVSTVLSGLAWVQSALCLTFLAGLAVVLKEPEQIIFGTPPALQRLLLVPPLCVVLAALTLLGLPIAWKYAYWRLSGRLHFTFVALAGLGFCWLLSYWNLLQFPAFASWLSH